MKRLLRSFVILPFSDVLNGLGPIMSGRNSARPTALMVASLIITWFVYVPIHELLHVLGCVATGGTVSELQVDWKYGGSILAKFFPFVKVGGDYAGRLTGFDTKGSDWVYLATDFMPFVLTVLLGVPWILMCLARARPILFGAGIVVGLAPIYQLPGDYFEMGSIVVTGLLTIVSGSETVVFQTLRSDDIFRLIGELFTKAGEMGLDTAGRLVAGILVIIASLAMAIFLALATYHLGRLWGRIFIRKSNAVASPD
jgi:hypothetical protein